jgi:hypothetical protein
MVNKKKRLKNNKKEKIIKTIFIRLFSLRIKAISLIVEFLNDLIPISSLIYKLKEVELDIT